MALSTQIPRNTCIREICLHKFCFVSVGDDVHGVPFHPTQTKKDGITIKQYEKMKCFAPQRLSTQFQNGSAVLYRG